MTQARLMPMYAAAVPVGPHVQPGKRRKMEPCTDATGRDQPGTAVGISPLQAAATQQHQPSSSSVTALSPAHSQQGTPQVAGTLLADGAASVGHTPNIKTNDAQPSDVLRLAGGADSAQQRAVSPEPHEPKGNAELHAGTTLSAPAAAPISITGSPTEQVLPASPDGSQLPPSEPPALHSGLQAGLPGAASAQPEAGTIRAAPAEGDRGLKAQPYHPLAAAPEQRLGPEAAAMQASPAHAQLPTALAAGRQVGASQQHPPAQNMHVNNPAHEQHAGASPQQLPASAAGLTATVLAQPESAGDAQHHEHALGQAHEAEDRGEPACHATSSRVVSGKAAATHAPGDSLQQAPPPGQGIGQQGPSGAAQAAHQPTEVAAELHTSPEGPSGAVMGAGLSGLAHQETAPSDSSEGRARGAVCTSINAAQMGDHGIERKASAQPAPLSGEVDDLDKKTATAGAKGSSSTPQVVTHSPEYWAVQHL